MCGIAGIIHFDHSAAQAGELERMLPFLAQRGPDGEGIWLQENLGFAHRRLSIIELSEKGRQPMTEASGTVTICYNGEIYNYRELRNYLETVWLPPSTGSDTEVLLNGYRRWGMDKLLGKIDGMFAFALHDARLQKIFLARDRFGEKPLYVFQNDKRIRFASDIRALAATEELALHHGALDHYLSELSTPQPHTIYNEVRQLPPGHFLEIDLRKKTITESCYWRQDFSARAISEEHALEETGRLLKQAVLSRTVSDVPVACLLSSGADSGLVTALLAEQGYSVNTFSVGFAWEETNELPGAKKLAQKLGTQHTEIFLEPDISQAVLELAKTFGEPFADSSAIPSHFIYREIRKSYKVALGGDGGDELFGGYYEYPLLWKAEQHAAKNNSFSKAKRMANALAWRAGLAEENTGNLEAYFNVPHAQKLFRGMGFSREEKNALYHSAFKAEHFTEEYFEKTWARNKQPSLTATLFAASLHTRLLNDYLVKVDRSAMAHGLEVRSPFLDPALSAFAASLPDELKLKNGTAKYLLKKLAEKHIAPDFMQRPKRGFGIPLREWMRKELKTFCEEILFSGSLQQRQLFEMKSVRRLFDAHVSGEADHTHKIWALVCLELWFSTQRT